MNYKRYLPTSLFGRALLIMVIPAVLVQLVAVYVFYERHWDSIVRNMSNTLAGQVRLIADMHESGQSFDKTRDAAETMGIILTRDKSKIVEKGAGKKRYPELYALLEEDLNTTFSIGRTLGGDDIEIALLMPDDILIMRMDKKRLVSSTTYVFMFLLGGSALILLIISVLFLRNQIRPIRQLAAAAERFGLGQDIPDFRPRGAAEVRQAGRAFMVMRARIQRQVSTRTEMLAGISHDLRTPLTRMKLQLAMMPQQDDTIEALSYDIKAMEHMIAEYLDFARGAGGESAEEEPIDDFIQRLVSRYEHHEGDVSFKGEADTTVFIQRNLLARALYNLIDNALRYGSKAMIASRKDGAYVVITVTDDGPGIPEEKMEEMFQPFRRLDKSRNEQTGGAGLGLSIARDAVQAHGGTIELRNLKKGGLQVSLNVPSGRKYEE